MTSLRHHPDPRSAADLPDPFDASFALSPHAEPISGERGAEALRGVRCKVRDGTLTMWGWLASHDQMHLALITAAGLDGVHAVVNKVKVLALAEHPALGGAATTVHPETAPSP